MLREAERSPAPTELRLLGESPRRRHLRLEQPSPSSSALPPATRGFYLRNLAGNLVIDSPSAARDLIPHSQRGEGKQLLASLQPPSPLLPPRRWGPAKPRRWLGASAGRWLPPSRAVPLPAGGSRGAARPFRSQTVEPRLCWKMDAVHPGRTEPPEAQERPHRRTVDRLSPELRMEKYILLSMDGKLLGPELSRIRSEMALPLERPDADLPQDLPSGYLCRQRRSLPSFPLPAGPQTPAELRSSSDVLCAGRFPAGLSRLVTGMQTPVLPSRRGSPPVPESGWGGAGR